MRNLTVSMRKSAETLAICMQNLYGKLGTHTVSMLKLTITMTASMAVAGWSGTCWETRAATLIAHSAVWVIRLIRVIKGY
jgi:hypothetical protein